ncbi:MAG: MMPL family transporter [Actinomycetota bacterium]|nr:MMPL family transporter [Actinomycetota bacterium]
MLAAWLLAVVIVGLGARALGGNTNNDLELPGTDSQQATDLLSERFPPQQNGKSPIVFRATSGKVTDPADKEAIQQSHQAIVDLPHVVSATSPFSQQGQGQVSKDDRTAFIPVLLDISSADLTEGIANRILDAAEPAERAGMKVAAGGPVGAELSEPDTASSDKIGLLAAMVILAFTFGTLAAMGLPILSAVFGLLVGLSLIGLLAGVVNVPDIAPTLATMIGLGVGIDYALFLVSRYRAERAEGNEIADSIATAVATSGTAIVFAGTTVVIALVTLLIAGIPLVTTLGYTAAFAVITAVLAAITLLPAVLALIGRHIDSLRLPAFIRPKPKPPDKGLWGAWARFVTGHPWRAVTLALAILLPLTVPFFSLELGQEDIGATPKSTTERQAYDLISEGFGPGYDGPLLVAVALGSPAQPSSTYEKQYAKAQSLQQQLEVEQQRGESQAAQLSAQADALEAEQARLEAEAAALKGQGAALEADKARLQASAEKLEKQRDIATQLDSLVREAASLLRQDAALAKQARTVLDKLERNRARIAATEARLQAASTPEERARLEARLRRLERRKAELERELAPILDQQAALKDQAAALKRQAAALRKQAKALGNKTIALAADAASDALDAVRLEQRRNQLIQEAADAQVQAAQLEVGKAQLEALQQQAETQQQQAEKLKSTLTAELTAAGGDERGTDPRLVSLQNGLGATIGVQLVSPPEINNPGDAAVFTVIAKTDPADEKTAELVVTIRDYVIPQSTAGTDADAHVGGQTASYVDLASGISSKLGLVIAAVIALGFLVLMMAFSSVLIPAQAAVANVLSVVAAFGVVTACFQFGWGLDLVGIDTDTGTDPIASFVPLIMFTVLFGLSMDYQVFLMSQIEHARAGAASDREAIAAGLASGARVIVAAALIMISVFGSFILNGDPTVKQFGVGLSVGVALAALTVLLLAPAVLVLAGKGSWWLPQWAERHLPRINIEGTGSTGDSSGRNPRKRPSMKL